MTNNGFSDKVKGTVNKVKGETKDQIGNATDNSSLQAEGKFDKLKGKAQNKVGELKDKHSDKDKY
ncbi:CsbD family protein [Sporosarcina sp. ANT_H38]|uniref:CsbD family protein n=1 Tax=Sporosarcina sp. ANT_H38 TaxID=2597358 RepID=UPI0011F38530|nr:CsbD family protein [Sporosarcina sp. ANT_H38]KAA0955893.1 CsbD family protein [Sporosarcina sp. ANT_H38]